MIYELRILSGMHRGATLPLDDHALVLGASEEADVVLTDAGIAQQHATLLLTESGWSLSALDGGMHAADSNLPEALIDLVPGDFARLGDIWITVVAQDAPWASPPSAPVDVEFEAIDGDDAPGESALEIPPPEMPAPGGPQAVAAAASQAVQPAAVAAAEGDPRRERRGRRIVYLPFIAAAALSAAAAYAITATHGASTAVNGSDGKAAMGSQPWKSVANSASVPPGTQRTPEELRQIFRKKLSNADLLKRFDLFLEDDSWFMQAALDDDEAARFERVLAKFMKEYNITFPVQAKVGSAEAMLPFKIAQIVSGNNASIVTRDGVRLYVGDEYRGMRLVAVNDTRVTFDGKRKIEVTW